MEAKLPTVKPGDEILAEHFTALYDFIRRCQLTVGENSGLDMESSAGGVSISSPSNEGFWISVTSNSSNNFAWTEQIPQSGGTWATGYQSGTTGSDPAHEVNGNTTSLPTMPFIAWAWRAPASNEVLFQVGSC